ncbi:MAG: restriction endonuclease subunit S [Rickettsiales bacterium]|nr:restriction endonuclease subunit S [Rickettsiales bacterium]
MENKWQTKKLGDVCDIYQPKTISTKELKSDGKYLVYGANGVIGRYDKFNHEELQLLITCRGATCGSVNISEPKSWINGNAMVVRPIDEIIDRDFLTYFFRDGSEISKTITGSAQPQITRTTLAPLIISFPESIDEQKRIVKILDEVFDSVANAKETAEKNLKNAREVFESYLQSVFEDGAKKWEKKTLSQISLEFGRGKSKHRPRNDPKLFGGIYPFIQTGDIRNSDHYITDYTQTYNEAGLSQSKLWPRGTICITIAANIAETGILDFEACFPDSVIGLIANPKMANVDFIEYLLKSFRSKLQKKGKGSAQDNLNIKSFENEFFPIPLLSEQNSIVAKLDALSAETKKLEEIYKQKLTHLEELKKSILKKAFNGEL